jgi:hypothetical protein
MFDGAPGRVVVGECRPVATPPKSREHGGGEGEAGAAGEGAGGGGGGGKGKGKGKGGKGGGGGGGGEGGGGGMAETSKPLEQYRHIYSRII